MLVSMTGFGRFSLEAPFGKLVAEVSSLNRKYLEILVVLPKEFSRFEPEVRKWVAEKVTRGQVTVRLYLSLNAKGVQAVLPDFALLQEFKRGWEALAQKLGFAPQSVDLSFLALHLPQLERVERAEEKELPLLRRCIEGALGALLQMKRREGKATALDLRKRLSPAKKWLKAIERLAPRSAAQATVKLRQKIEEIARLGKEAEEKLFREVVSFAERSDISEEIARLSSHFAQFSPLLSSAEGSVGRKMEFLLQEMGREINTIGAKATEAKISHLVVAMKSEFEKMREQIQNIE